MNRLETEFGNDGFEEQPFGSLKPFSARYQFAGRTFSILVWARDWTDAEQYCHDHGMVMDGLLLERISW